MESNYLKCTFCVRDFDLKQRQPYIIIDCGHSICQSCLSQHLMLRSAFTCPEDMVVISPNGKSLSDFPKNHALINMMNNANGSRSPSNNDNRKSLMSLKGMSERVTKPSTSYAERTLSEKITIAPKLSLTGQKGGQNKQFVSNDSNSYSEENIEDVCLKHHKRLEVICTEPECRTKVCYQCGLFGDHKGHKVEPEVEFFNRADKLAQSLSDTLDSVKKRENYAFHKFLKKIVREAIDGKKDEIRRRLNKSYDVG